MMELFSPQWRLARLEMVNWGTFSGHHTVDVSRDGHLFTGASGSGKSSLLDAIAAVLTPDKWLRFNAAAQESATGRNDRSLVSYVRGAWSKEADELEDRAVTSYLRPGATWSGILLRFEDGEHPPVTLVRLMHLRGTATDNRSLNDACIITRTNSGLLDFQAYSEKTIDVRRLKADLEPVVVTSNRSHGPFYARLRSLLDISSDNALHLLHKTQSAKNLGTLDALFRDFMLDEPQTFARAETAIEQFSELSEAHRHVVDLREQAQVLRQAVTAADAFETAAGEADEARRMGELVLPYAATIKRELAQAALAEAHVRRAAAEQASTEAQATAEQAYSAWESARLATQQVGGTDATHLRQRIVDAEQRVEEVAQERQRLAARLTAVEVAVPASAAEFAELQVTARRELDSPGPERIGYELLDTAAEARKQVTALEREVAELRHRRSNISGPLLRARAALAEQMSVDEDALPFAGELIEVRQEHAEWTGAIERVLAPLARALLVRDDMLAEVRRLVDRQHLDTRLMIEAVPPDSDAPPRSTDGRSVVRRVRVSEGPFAAYLNRRIGADFDVACVDSADDLDGVTRGVTREGLYKRSARRYEKDDRHRVDDRSTWVLGGSNADKLATLLESLNVARHAQEQAERHVDSADATRQQALARRDVLAEVAQANFARLDREAAVRHLEGLRRELEALVSPDSDLDRALRAEQDAKDSYDALRARAKEVESDYLQHRNEEKRLSAMLADLGEQAGEELGDADREALQTRFVAVRRSLRLDVIDQTAHQVSTALAKEQHAADGRVRRAESGFVEQATRYRDAWPAQAADLTVDVEDRAAYRALLANIDARGLPKHEANFLRLLKERSRDTLIYLRDEIYSAPRRVEERVDPVNESLRRSLFDVGRYLQIRVKTRRGGEVEEFLSDLGAVVEGNFHEETMASAEKRFAVLKRLMARLSSSEYADTAWRRRVLDTRGHVTFLASEVSEDGRVLSVHDSSSGLSGGQRQKLVVFCLAAALRYQLADADQTMPRYGTIILDEAFDKADAQYTRMAMEIFREFGFHMVLATPQKLLQTLEPYIGAVTSVANPTRKASTLAHVAFEAASA